MKTPSIPPSDRIRIGVAAAIGISLVIALVVSVLMMISGRGLAVVISNLSSPEELAYRKILEREKNMDLVRIPQADAPLTVGTLPDVLITRMGAELNALSASFDTVPDSFLRRVPPSVRKASLGSGERVFVLPLQLDQFQVSYNISKFASVGVKPGDELSAEEFAHALGAFSSGSGPAILVAGGEDETLLLLLSAICEAKGGLPAYRALVRALLGSPELVSVRDEFLGRTPDGTAVTLSSIIEELRAWRKNGYLHEEWHRMKAPDIISYLRSGFGFIMMGTLSFRRTVPYQTIVDYGWSPYPGEPGLRERASVAPLTVAAVKTGIWGMKKGERALALLEVLTDPQKAMDLATATGRSTTLSAALAPDVQAADALAWAAGANLVVNGLFLDAFISYETAHAFAEDLRMAVNR